MSRGIGLFRQRPTPVDTLAIFSRNAFQNEGVASDGYPVPPRTLWHSGASSFQDFMNAGMEHYQTMRNLIKAHGFPSRVHHRVLDFGCSIGRTVRMWKDETWAEVWGCEIDSARLQWCRTYLSDRFRFVQTSTEPRLPFEDRFFSLIYAGSVFTHIRELPDCWLLELVRVLEPGGLLYITLHDENTWRALRSGSAPALAYLAQHSSLRTMAELDHDFLAVGHGDECQVFYRSEYFLSVASKWLEVLDVKPGARGYQTAVILRKPEVHH